MQLCWNQLARELAQDSIQLETQEPGAQELIKLFNKKAFDQSAVSPENIYTKSGYGPETLETIKQDMSRLFPDRSTDTLSDLFPELVDLICFSYLSKNFQHQSTFQEIEMQFLDLSVKGFSPEPPSTKGIEVIDYDNDDNFVLKLIASNDRDEIILVKGNEGASMEEILTFLANPPQSSPINIVDTVQIPTIRLDVARTYSELIGSKLTSKGDGYFVLSSMEEQIKLSLDDQGASVENEATMVFTRGLGPRPRNFILDRPFWLILKEESVQQPYLIVKVSHHSLLEKVA